MSSFPAYARILRDGYSEKYNPSILRTDMDRGVPKQRIENSRVMAEISLGVLFKTKADSDSFEDWYFNTLGRVDWFDFTLPRTKQVVRARFKDADMGSYEALTFNFGYSKRSFVLEYLK